MTAGVSVEQAGAEFSTLGRQAEQSFPDTEKGWGVMVRTLPDFLIYSFGIRSAMGTFHGDEAVKFTTVSGPISGALVVTAFGILVAVEAVILFNYFSQRAARIGTEMKLLTDEFLELLLEQKKAKGESDGDREAP